ncbi:Acetyl-coenzyme A carboxyl transferase alpha chain [hydrothermal vent metagenome]|uniref:acetyl-CoA carboxytransferase n=1 Tax=hydrothermal vent metagenome TaxID=652676 RepID=A0A1W1CU45_9ZZZZ
MNTNFLDFEQPIAELEEKIQALQNIKDENIDIQDELKSLQSKSTTLTKKIFSDLSDWQISKLARHPNRPQTLFYIQEIFDNFIELHGDRHFGDDNAIIGGIAQLNEQSVMLIGQQKGENTHDKIKHNFGMPQPEGYRKALRLMKLAEKFNLPIITFIDTPGAFPGIEAEERNQSEAIAKNLYEMSGLKTPTIAIVIGEGGSGGALAIGVVDTMIMLEYSVYSVISPEGCASILYKDAKKSELAASSLKLTANYLQQENLIDVIVSEPLGGAHRQKHETAINLKENIINELKALSKQTTDELITKRHQKILNFGKFK